MINLTGIVNFTKGVLNKGGPASFDRSTAAFDQFRYHDGTVSISNNIQKFYKCSPQPYVSGDLICFAVGELYDTPTGETTLNYLLDHFIARGFKDWEKVNGQFVCVIYDRQNSKLHVINDRFGFRQFYYHLTDGDFNFGSEIKNLKQHVRLELDPVGLFELMAFSYQIGDCTCFSNVKALPAASILTYSASGLSIQRYWRAVYAEEADSVTHEKISESLEIAIKRQMKGERKSLFLSGGMDSRVVAHYASERDKRITAITFGNKNSMDVKFARTVAGKLGLKHLLFEFDPEVFISNANLTVQRTEGCANFMHFKSVQFHPEIKSCADYIITGIPGDMVFGSTVLQQNFGVVQPEELMKHSLSRIFEHSIDELKTLFREDCFDEIYRNFEAQFFKTFEGNTNKLAADFFDSWFLENRVRRFTLTGPSSDNYLFCVRTPFLDYDLFDLSLKIPVAERFAEKIYLETIIKYIPKLRWIPWQKTGLPILMDEREKQLWDKRGQARAAINSIAGKIGFQPFKPLEKIFIDYQKLYGNPVAAKYIQDHILSKGQKWHQFFDLEQLEQVVSQHFTGVKDQHNMISKLLNLSLLEENFVSNSHC